ncbi:alpha/beta hydrolase [Candidatus Xianfuyuplasma coldseepsis]|uniref:Alpha/beta hydrolase fold-5 domain-containing protein n=1 Tax=Candidatus Xianfuyuplasma coldseepsis TaxID=2782163 RepID=A0A7L7KUL4_9MOLU|nr:alpha/beta hydrolase [Xianfuyuplasma coldseepsis]QMS85468.1 hypothetical protein G4Z02_06830 [Xianfuyuplasma coldseepsis]
MSKLDKLFLYSLIGGVVFSLVILLMPTSIYDFYPNPEIYDYGFNYYLWKFRAIDQSMVARVTAWVLFFAHFGSVVYLLNQLKKHQAEKQDGYTKYNVYLLVTNALFIVLHYIHTWLWYDALAQDTPVWSSQGSVIVMLVLILIIENRRRGLFFGKKMPFPKESTRAVMKYHGIYIALATIFTFWYHPMENTSWHIVGFFYMYLLFIQMSFARTKLHQNKYFNVTLEVMVLFHGTAVALYSGNAPWAMFLFGFATIFFITQIYGLGLNKTTIHIMQGLFVLIALATYSGLFNDRAFYEINEVVRIPFIEYGLVFVFVYMIYGWIKLPVKPWVKNTIGGVLIATLGFFTILTVYTMSSYYAEPEMYDAIVDIEGLTRSETSKSIVYETESYDTNIILIPGGKVDTGAYEYLAYLIAQEGYKVTIVKNPFNLAILLPYRANQFYEADKNNVIMGHSLGGVVASMNASRLDYDMLVIMGSYPISDVGDTVTLLLVGSEENLLDNEAYYENRNTLANYTEHIIPGGNHAYFGYYGEQKGDNPAMVTNQENQEYVAGYIVTSIENEVE